MIDEPDTNIETADETMHRVHDDVLEKEAADSLQKPIKVCPVRTSFDILSKH